ncbi:hypothetical protein TNCV_112461 [Trichonephila clavipes]|nr:hypothetical protein TNCV_112461 [Trichonephila clavipes]
MITKTYGAYLSLRYLKRWGLVLNRTRVWRRTGQRSDPAFIVERHTAKGVTVYFLGHTINQGTLTAAVLYFMCYPCYQVTQVPFINKIMLVQKKNPNGLKSFANRAFAGKATAASPRDELTAQMQRLWQDLKVISDLIKSMPRRISACIAARGGFTY